MNDLDKLKELLFGAEKQALDSITRRVERREARAADVADILPEAIHESHEKSRDLVDALYDPVGDCVQRAFHEDPQTYSDALYPVIGPAIRKSIMHALRNLSQQINTAVEQSLTPRGLKWRLQASRAGIPFGEFVLQKTLLYRVEQAYLISRENGLLVAHVHHDAARIKDSDAVSAMFTAIQDFVKESFSPDRTGRLESADMGEFTLWAVHGPHALLVCVIRGVPPRSLRAELSAVLERIHFRYGDAIRAYAGDTGSVAGVENELGRCLQFEVLQKDERKKSGPPKPMLILLLLAALLIGYFAATRWMQSRELDRLTDALEATPGVYVADAYRDDGRIVVDGMRDPLAPSIGEVARAAGVRTAVEDARMRPFQSLDPELIVRRAERLFGRPEGIGFAVSGSRLIVSGPAGPAYRQRVQSGLPALAGVEAVEFPDAAPDPVALLEELLEPPATVLLAETADGIALTGSAPLAWFEAARARIAAADLAWPVDLSGLTAVPAVDPSRGIDEELAAEVGALSGARFLFSSGMAFADDNGARLETFAARLASLAQRAGRSGRRLTVAVTGSTDGTGDLDANEILAQRRAEAAAAILVSAGVDSESITRAAITPRDGVRDAGLRRVTIDLELADASPLE